MILQTKNVSLFEDFLSECQQTNACQRNAPGSEERESESWYEVVRHLTDEKSETVLLQIATSDVRCQTWLLKEVCDYIAGDDRDVGDLSFSLGGMAEACVRVAALTHFEALLTEEA